MQKQHGFSLGGGLAAERFIGGCVGVGLGLRKVSNHKTARLHGQCKIEIHFHTKYWLRALGLAEHQAPCPRSSNIISSISLSNSVAIGFHHFRSGPKSNPQKLRLKGAEFMSFLRPFKTIRLVRRVHSQSPTLEPMGVRRNVMDRVAFTLLYTTPGPLSQIVSYKL